MADKSFIEWTDATWNVITGCSRVSSGCGGPDGGGCYAERLAATRLRRHPSRRGLTDRHGRWTGEVRFNKQWLDQPLRWQKPRRIFVCAHSDLFPGVAFFMKQMAGKKEIPSDLMVRQMPKGRA